MVHRSWHLVVRVDDRDDPNRGAVTSNGQLEARYVSGRRYSKPNPQKGRPD